MIFFREWYGNPFFILMEPLTTSPGILLVGLLREIQFLYGFFPYKFLSFNSPLCSKQEWDIGKFRLLKSLDRSLGSWRRIWVSIPWPRPETGSWDFKFRFLDIVKFSPRLLTQRERVVLVCTGSVDPVPVGTTRWLGSVVIPSDDLSRPVPVRSAVDVVRKVFRGEVYSFLWTRKWRSHHTLLPCEGSKCFYSCNIRWYTPPPLRPHPLSHFKDLKFHLNSLC